MLSAPRVVHHVCPYGCCHLAHVDGRCPLESCSGDVCPGGSCSWYDEILDMPSGIGHFASKWVEVHRDGAVPVP